MPFIRQRQHDAAEKDVHQSERGDVAVSGVKPREDGRRQDDRQRPAPSPDQLVRIAAEDELFVERGRKEDGRDPGERQPVTAHVVHRREQKNERVGRADQDGREERAGGELAKRDRRRGAEAEIPAAFVDQPDRRGRGDAGARKSDPLEKRKAGPESGQECGKIKRNVQREGSDEAIMKRPAGDIAALVLRVATGLIFIPHGYAKVFGRGGPAAFAADLPSYHIPSFLGYVVAYAEFYGAILLIAGLLTRIDAFLLACNMAVAVAVVQLPDALNGADPGANRFFAAMKGIELPLALFGAAFALLLLGAGRWSLDALLRIEERVARTFSRREKVAEGRMRGAAT